MPMEKRKNNRVIPWYLAVAAAVLLCFCLWIGVLSRRQKDAGRYHLEQAIRRCAVACYAAEGIYPPDLDYLREHYGLQIDETRYRVFYEVFADDLMPEITVLERVK